MFRSFFLGCKPVSQVVVVTERKRVAKVNYDEEREELESSNVDAYASQSL